MSFSFLDKDNVCGLTLLQLVSRGNAIVAEILRLRNHTSVFSLNNEDNKRYAYEGVLFDFRYLKAPDRYEAVLTSSETLMETDEIVQENHMHLLERFYLLFESIYHYNIAYNKYVSDLNNGFYIQHSLVGVLLDTDGKQLLAEGLYLYGVMLFMLDRCLPGVVRERIVIAYMRYKGEAQLRNVEQIITLCRSAEKLVHLFGRFPVDEEVAKMIIGRLQSDDVYLSTTVAFPSPEHRSIALANQASMIFVILHFLPEYLISKKATMREIIDKFFNDYWIVPVYMGLWVDLEIEWGATLPAARDALANIVDRSHVQELTNKYTKNLDIAQEQLDRYLTKGMLTETFVLSHTSELINCLRNANSTTRWFMLQRKASNKYFRKLILSSLDPGKLIQLLLSVSQLEMNLKEMLKRLLEDKRQLWESCKLKCVDMMKELSRYFTGTVPLTRIERNDTLVNWFTRLETEINTLDYGASNPTFVGRRIQKVVTALEDVEQYNEIDTNLQVKQFLQESRESLLKMVKVVSLEDEVLATIEIVTDMSYAWEIINDYSELIHSRIRKDPQAVSSLRAMFLKLASILDTPLVRINQANSADTISVAAYYSNELMHYVRRVLEVIPKTVFKVLTQLIELQTSKLTELPTKLETTKLQDFAQLDQRYELARMTYLVSVFTQGILSMQNTRTILGVLEVEPRSILVDGIRKELVLRICDAMDKELRFDEARDVAQVERKLNGLAARLDGFRRSFEYIQDYVNVCGLQVWHEEFSRVIQFNVEQECNKYLKRKLFAEESQYQSTTATIPICRFVGRTEQMLLDLTIPGVVVFSLETSSWYKPTGELSIGLRFWSILRKSVGVAGLRGFDRLLSFRLSNTIQQVLKWYQRKSITNEVMPLLHQVNGELSSLSPPKDGHRFFLSLIKQSQKLSEELLPLVLQVGQAQLVRTQLCNELHSGLQTEANQLYLSLDALNNCVMGELKDNTIDDLSALARLLETTGFSTPLQKVYVTSEPCTRIPGLMFLLLISCIGRLQYDPKLSAVKRGNTKDQPLDGSPLVAGIWTILNQFHSDYCDVFMKYAAQYIRCNTSVDLYRSSVANMILLLREMCTLANIPNSYLLEFIPEAVVT